jgi:hypothetical protein
VLLARAGLIGGYGDRSDRLGYWPARVARASPDEVVLVPHRDTDLQVVDGPTTVGGVLDPSSSATGARPRSVEAPDDWLVEQGVEP